MDTHGIDMDSNPNTSPCDTVFPEEIYWDYDNYSVSFGT